jgi:predicted ATP-dependent serine protease
MTDKTPSQLALKDFNEFMNDPHRTIEEAFNVLAMHKDTIRHVLEQHDKLITVLDSIKTAASYRHDSAISNVKLLADIEERTRKTLAAIKEQK